MLRIEPRIASNELIFVQPGLSFPLGKSRLHLEPQMAPQQARAALATVDRGKRRVIEEIDLPRWYLWGLALAGSVWA
jgi:hypothetical protein